MRDLLPQLLDWIDSGNRFAVATIVRTVGSTPKSAGAAMAVSADGRIAGGISAGCVESELIELANQVLAEGNSINARYGPDDDFGPGFSCGGTIDVVIRDSDSLAGDLTTAARKLAAGQEAAIEISDDYTLHLTSSPHLIICGATDVAVALHRIGKLLGYRVTVCDARPAFATQERFPEADEIVVDWPHRFLESTPVRDTTALCSFAHDQKFAIPLLEAALRRPLAYVGAMGSRKTCAERESELRARGLTDDQLARLHSPIGLDLGGRTPAEIAVAIAAQIIAERA